jgi:hypothetical protein
VVAVELERAMRSLMDADGEKGRRAMEKTADTKAVCQCRGGRVVARSTEEARRGTPRWRSDPEEVIMLYVSIIKHRVCVENKLALAFFIFSVIVRFLIFPSLFLSVDVLFIYIVFA